jgi:hypothetical protein
MLAASNNGHFNIVRWLYQNGASKDVCRPNNRGETPMLQACARGNFAMVKWLSDNGAIHDIIRPTSRDVTPVLLACEGDHLKILKWMIMQGCLSPKDFPVQRLGQNSARVLYHQGINNRDVDYEGFLTLVTNRRFYKSTAGQKNVVVGIHHLPMGVLRILGGFLCGTTKTRCLWKRVVEGNFQCHECQKLP